MTYYSALTPIPCPSAFYGEPLLPGEALEEVDHVFQFGAGKHGAHNWRTPNPNGGDPLKAAGRHIDAHQRGEVFDHETGFFSLAHAAARVLMALGRAQQQPRCLACEMDLPRVRKACPGAGFTCRQCKNHYPAFHAPRELLISRSPEKPRVPAFQTRIFADIIAERQRQDQKFGQGRKLGAHTRLAILMEEVGEVATGIMDRDRPNLREELVQVAAVCVAWLEEHDAQTLELEAKDSSKCTL